MKGRTSHITLLLSSSDIEKRAIGINSLKSLMNYEVSSPAIKSYQDNLKVALEKYEKQKTDALLSNLLKIIDFLDFEPLPEQPRNNSISPVIHGPSISFIDNSHQVLVKIPLSDNTSYTVGLEGDYSLNINTQIIITYTNKKVLIQEYENQKLVFTSLPSTKILPLYDYIINNIQAKFKISKDKIKFIYKAADEQKVEKTIKSDKSVL